MKRNRNLFAATLLATLCNVTAGCDRASEPTAIDRHETEATARPHGSSKRTSPAGTAVAAAPLASAAAGQPQLARDGRMRGEAQESTEGYDTIRENAFTPVGEHPLSTFSTDVDTASYSNVRRFLRDGTLPPVDAVRIEELVNYFDYDYAEPQGDAPFSVTTEVATAPWAAGHEIVMVGLQGKNIAQGETPAKNLVFLVDVSGSMNDARKLPLLKRSLRMLVERLSERDHVAIVVYAGAAGAALEPTSGADSEKILAALDRLEAGGSTNGGAGIELAYRLAEQSFQKGAVNRVILATDGDFNVGVSNRDALVRLIEEKRESGVSLSVLGFGTGNVKDATMESLADHGNGNYAYIDSIAEAKKVLVEQAGGTLVTIAKDVKIQVEWNPSAVQSYRLIGYEDRLLADRDFNDDKKDAGDIGAGHRVTALYEIVPAAGQQQAAVADLMTVKLRYKAPEASESQLISVTVPARASSLSDASESLRFASAVAGYGMLLRNSAHKGTLGWQDVETLGRGALGSDAHGYRKEFLDLVTRARSLADAKRPPLTN